MGILTRIKNNRLKKKLLKKDLAYKSIMFVIGAFISALSFNLFFVPNNFVSGGLGGIAVMFNHLFGFDTTVVILVGDILFLILSVIVFGFKDSLFSIIGASTYVLFVYLTKDFVTMLNFSFDNILLYVLAAGFVTGFGEALVYKSGFNTGGNSVPALVIQKYTKMPLGKILRIISIIIILLGGFTFGYTAIMYALIISVISSYMVDKLLIGISDSKTFFIQSNKNKEIEDYIIRVIGSGVTEFDTKGAFLGLKGKMLMCAVPTEKYSSLKSAIEEIDKNAFIIVNDCYEVYGGTKRKKIFD